MISRESTATRPMMPQAIIAAAFFDTLPRSSAPFRKAPRNGRTGISQISSFMGDSSPLTFEIRGLIESRRLAQPEERDEDPEPHRRLARGDGDGEDREDLA